MEKFRISASILSANFAELGPDVVRALDAGADMVHIDVMDHHYVPNLTFGPLVCRSLREYGIKAPLDVHLMVTPVDSLILPFVEAGADYICFHPDATSHVDRTLQLIKSYGVKAGLALNPAVSPSELEYVLDKVDMILVMSVNPGFAKQQLIPSAFDKIKKIRTQIEQADHPILLSVDGGISPHTIADAAHAGADTFVVGSALFGSSDYEHTVQQLRSALAPCVRCD